MKPFLTTFRRPVLTAALAGLVGATSHAGEVLYTSFNTTVTAGHAYSDLEHDNPFALVTKLRGMPMIEWLDAGTGGGGTEDWSVSGSHGGDANEVWLQDGTSSASTSTTVRTERVSIHLHGDDNDGLALIYVDGLHVATVDMYTPGNPLNYQVFVDELPRTIHDIEIASGGDSPTSSGTTHDVAIMGAAAVGMMLMEDGTSFQLSTMQLEIPYDDSCLPACPVGSLAISFWDNMANPAVDAAIAGMNIGPTLEELGGCVPLGGADLCLNPSDPLFHVGISAFGVGFFAPDGDGNLVWESNVVPADFPCDFTGLEFKFQALRANIVTGNLESSSEVYRLEPVACGS